MKKLLISLILLFGLFVKTTLRVQAISNWTECQAHCSPAGAGWDGSTCYCDQCGFTGATPCSQQLPDCEGEIKCMSGLWIGRYARCVCVNPTPTPRPPTPTPTPKPVNGSCGSAEKNYETYQTSFSGSFCSSGSLSSTPSFPSRGSSVSWTCSGKNGGSNDTCTATRKANASCGSAARTYQDYQTRFIGPLCDPGTASPNPSFPSRGTNVSWTCLGLYGGSNSSTCTASRKLDGKCGSAYQCYSATDTSFSGNFCARGTLASTPSFPRQGRSSTWTCRGSNGGSDVTCRVYRDTPWTDWGACTALSPCKGSPSVGCYKDAAEYRTRKACYNTRYIRNETDSRSCDMYCSPTIGCDRNLILTSYSQWTYFPQTCSWVNTQQCAMAKTRDMNEYFRHTYYPSCDATVQDNCTNNDVEVITDQASQEDCSNPRIGGVDPENYKGNSDCQISSLENSCQNELGIHDNKATCTTVNPICGNYVDYSSQMPSSSYQKGCCGDSKLNRSTPSTGNQTWKNPNGSTYSIFVQNPKNTYQLSSNTTHDGQFIPGGKNLNETCDYNNPNRQGTNCKRTFPCDDGHDGCTNHPEIDCPNTAQATNNHFPYPTNNHGPNCGQDDNFCGTCQSDADYQPTSLSNVVLDIDVDERDPYKSFIKVDWEDPASTTDFWEVEVYTRDIKSICFDDHETETNQAKIDYDQCIVQGLQSECRDQYAQKLSQAFQERQQCIISEKAKSNFDANQKLADYQLFGRKIILREQGQSATFLINKDMFLNNGFNNLDKSLFFARVRPWNDTCYLAGLGIDRVLSKDLITNENGVKINPNEDNTTTITDVIYNYQQKQDDYVLNLRVIKDKVGIKYYKPNNLYALGQNNYKLISNNDFLDKKQAFKISEVNDVDWTLAQNVNGEYISQIMTSLRGNVYYDDKGQATHQINGDISTQCVLLNDPNPPLADQNLYDIFLNSYSNSMDKSNYYFKNGSPYQANQKTGEIYNFEVPYNSNYYSSMMIRLNNQQANQDFLVVSCPSYQNHNLPYEYYYLLHKQAPYSSDPKYSNDSYSNRNFDFFVTRWNNNFTNPWWQLRGGNLFHLNQISNNTIPNPSSGSLISRCETDPSIASKPICAPFLIAGDDLYSQDTNAYIKTSKSAGMVYTKNNISGSEIPSSRRSDYTNGKTNLAYVNTPESDSQYSLKRDYDYYLSLSSVFSTLGSGLSDDPYLGKDLSDFTSNSGNCAFEDDENNDLICKMSNNLTVSIFKPWFFDKDHTLTIFVPGDLHIRAESIEDNNFIPYNLDSSPIKVAQNKYLAFIVQGDMIIESQVGNYNRQSNPGKPAYFGGDTNNIEQEKANIEGVYIVSGKISIDGNKQNARCAEGVIPLVSPTPNPNPTTAVTPIPGVTINPPPPITPQPEEECKTSLDCAPFHNTCNCTYTCVSRKNMPTDSCNRFCGYDMRFIQCGCVNGSCTEIN